MPDEPQPWIAAHGLTAARGGRTLFRCVQFELGPGAALRVEGPNGAGKSTLLRILAGLLMPVAGTVEQCGRLAYLGHRNALKPEQSLARELAFWGSVRDVREDWGLAPLMNVPLRMLSEGQLRRAALLRLASSGAAIWLLDEPGAGLDGDSRERLARLVDEHRRAGGVAVVATHGETVLERADVLRL